MNKYTLRTVILTLFTAILIIIAWATIVGHHAHPNENVEGFESFASDYHITLMIAMIFIAGTYGFLWANFLKSEVTKTRKTSKDILHTVFLFLNKEEKAIIEYLYKNGERSQADISRLEGLNRVKAHRALNKMKNKNLIEINSFGKVRKIKLKDNIKQTLE